MSKVAQAFAFAEEAHRGHRRKSTDIPYIAHPMEVAAILIRNRAHEDLICAGLLHDTVEDTPATLDEIEKAFGPVVANLVKGATEPQKMQGDGRSAEKSWRDRKEHTVEHLKEASADLKLLACADKLANLIDLVNNYKNHGEALWKRFNAGRDQQAWYYQSLVTSLAHGENSIEDRPAFRQFRDLVSDFFSG